MKLKLYGKLHDIYGSNEIKIEEKFTKLNELKEFLKKNYREIYENTSFLVCREKYLLNDDDIHDCDEVSLFPAFSGG